MAGQNPYAPVLNFIDELKRCDTADLTSASVLMVFVGIDLMALLAAPAGKTEQTRADFIAWADKGNYALDTASSSCMIGPPWRAWQ
jgi:hypothetical protein